jgi:hypothetical protein
VLVAEQRIDDLLRPRRVAIGLMRVVRMHSIPTAWLLVNVRVDDPAVVVNDWRVADDFVIHGLLGLVDVACLLPTPLVDDVDCVVVNFLIGEESALQC